MLQHQQGDSCVDSRSCMGTIKPNLPNLKISIPEDGMLQNGIMEFQVRNTFIHLADDDDCYDLFLQERAIQSCPGSHVGRLSSTFLQQDESMTPKEVCTQAKPVIRLQDALSDWWPATPETFHSVTLGFPKPFLGKEQVSVQNVPSVAEQACIPVPQIMEMPSIGSVLHSSGECKPCAFLYTKGCGNGLLCKFCHLCEAGEKKRRQKEKQASFKGGA